MGVGEAERPRRAAAGAGLNVRARTAADLDECVRLLEAVHQADAYPTHWPEDASSWLQPDSPIGAWIAERDGRIVGHVALRASHAGARAAAWSSATGVPPERFAEITRLFVAPDRRRAGIARALVDAACSAAAARGLHPALEVVDTDRAAILFYERRGWRRVSSEPWMQAPQQAALLHRYVAPFK